MSYGAPDPAEVEVGLRLLRDWAYPDPDGVRWVVEDVSRYGWGADGCYAAARGLILGRQWAGRYGWPAMTRGAP